MSQHESQRPDIIKVLLVDDHPVVRDGLATYVDSQEDMEVCGEAEDVAEALNLIRNCRPDVAVVDIARV